MTFHPCASSLTGLILPLLWWGFGVGGLQTSQRVFIWFSETFIGQARVKKKDKFSQTFKFLRFC